ncbi:hypothetical protein AAG570_000379 [Ranatra chinensis]|uniref:Uncharacterized protein n=1 Tax=Ranatra chinensis TaxID=642074 RepID=A0ABD0YWY1_9HEMI
MGNGLAVENAEGNDLGRFLQNVCEHIDQLKREKLKHRKNLDKKLEEVQEAYKKIYKANEENHNQVKAVTVKMESVGALEKLRSEMSGHLEKKEEAYERTMQEKDTAYEKMYNDAKETYKKEQDQHSKMFSEMQDQMKKNLLSYCEEINKKNEMLAATLAQLSIAYDKSEL